VSQSIYNTVLQHLLLIICALEINQSVQDKIFSLALFDNLLLDADDEMFHENVEDLLCIFVMEETIELRKVSRFFKVLQSGLVDVLLGSSEHHSEQESTHLSQIKIFRDLIFFLDLLNKL